MSQLVLLDADLGFARDLTRNLRGRGLEVEHFPSFMEFALGSREFGPQVFVLDFETPDPSGGGRGGGLSNLKKLRALFGVQPKIWVLVRHDGPEVGQECLKSGADLVLYKGPTADDTAEDVAFAWRSLFATRSIGAIQVSGPRASGHRELTR